MPRVAQATRPAVRTMEAPAQKKQRLRKNASQRSMLDIPEEILAKLGSEGIDLQWVTDSVLGQPAAQVRMSFEINGWEPVTPDMWGALFDGMFTKRGHTGEINYEGLVLMWRPMYMSDEARAEDAAARNNALLAQQNMIKGGQIPGMSSGFEPDHPTAIGRNVFSRSVHAPMDIPKE